MALPLKAYCTQLLGPITALAFAKDLLFAGEGPYLKLFPVSRIGDTVDQGQHGSSSKHPLAWRIFDTQAIHGIVVAHDSGQLITLIIYGGCFVRVAAIPKEKTAQETVHLGKVQRCSDWIVDLAIRPRPVEPGSGLLQAVAVTAHNALIGLTVSKWNSSGHSENSCGDVVQETLTGATKCMLYAASVHWLTPRIALVVSGTAFGEIIVWTCHIDDLSEKGIDRLRVHYSFPAHDGSIFGLDIHFSAYQSDGQPARAMLASCSDDRTIRIWDVSGALPSAHIHAVDNDLQTNSDASDVVAVQNTQAAESLLIPAPACFSKLWAHSSRIWHVKFAPCQEKSGNTSSVTVFSFGEDATAQTWNLQLGDENHPNSASRFQNVDVFSGHAGKNIWSHAITKEPSGNFIIATGGADGCIVVGRVSNVRIHGGGSEVGCWALQNVTSNLVSDRQDKASASWLEDGFKTYCFVGEDTIILTTQRGMVVRVAFPKRTKSETSHETGVASHFGSASFNDVADANQSDPAMEPQLIYHNQSLASYSVIVGLPSLRIAFLGAADGQILSYHDQSQTLKPWIKMESKISGLFVSQSPDQTESKVYLLATELGRGCATLFALPGISGLDSEVSQNTSTKLSLPGGFVVTSMTYSGSSLNMILLGSRDGRIFLYPLTRFAIGHEYAVDTSECVSSTNFHQIGQHLDAVTSMLIQKLPLPGRCHVLSTARDSTYAIHEISATLSGVSAVRIHSSALPFGPNIEGAHWCKSLRGLSFYGFHSKDFVEYSETGLTEILRVECGGAHRVWTYQPARPHDDNCSHLIWTKAAQMHSMSQNEPKCNVIKHGGHGREIKACARRPRPIVSNSSFGIFVTGAEDTDIRFFQHVSDDCTRSIKCVSVLKKHNTGIQQLRWSDDGRYLFSCGGCEELFVWRIRDDPGQEGFVRLHVVCEATLPPASEVPDLRIMNISIQQHEQEIAGQDDVQVWFSLFMVYSDSTMRTYSYTPFSATFHLVSTGMYKTCCLTQGLYLTSTSSLAITGATDGTISIWNTHGDNESIDCIHTTRVHQNAIKDMALVNGQMSGTSNISECLIFSVGDDNAIAVTRIIIDNERSCNVSTASLILARAHAAAATALNVVSKCQFGERIVARIITSGNDQRLKSWEFSCDLTCPGVEGIDVRRLSNDAVAVADVSCMAGLEDAPSLESATWSSKEIMICGVGMQFFTIE